MQDCYRAIIYILGFSSVPKDHWRELNVLSQLSRKPLLIFSPCVKLLDSHLVLGAQFLPPPYVMPEFRDKELSPFSTLSHLAHICCHNCAALIPSHTCSQSPTLFLKKQREGMVTRREGYRCGHLFYFFLLVPGSTLCLFSRGWLEKIAVTKQNWWLLRASSSKCGTIGGSGGHLCQYATLGLTVVLWQDIPCLLLEWQIFTDFQMPSCTNFRVIHFKEHMYTSSFRFL